MAKKTRYEELCKTLALRVAGYGSEKIADKYLKALYEIIVEQLDMNDEFVLPKFGKFYIEHVEEKEMISTGKGREKRHIYVPPKREIKFIPYGKLYRDLNDEDVDKKNPPTKYTVAKLFQKSLERQKRKDNYYGKGRS